MDLILNIDIPKPAQPVRYTDKLMLLGSCFTEHIGNALEQHKFSILQNPHGILFDPASVCKSILSYIENRRYTASDLFQLNEVWNSWDHHSRFSDTDQQVVLDRINTAQEQAHHFLKSANWLVITLGSSFSYRLVEQQFAGVANCHRAPAQWFNKHMLTIEETLSMLDATYHRLQQFNPDLQIIFTVSPVRHIRDGVVENNRSKARLLEAVHHLVQKFDHLYYFPAYEIVIDVLRDYRFYDIDLVHPNYSATSYVMEKFTAACMDEPTRQLMEEVKKITIARNHRPFQPHTEAHARFLKSHAEKTTALMKAHPYLDLHRELAYFSGQEKS